jgi:hypothetical protein
MLRAAVQGRPVFMKKVLRISLGVFLVILGLIGLALPIVPQWPMLIPGLIILAEYFPPVRRFLRWAKSKLEARYPALAHKLHRSYPAAFAEDAPCRTPEQEPASAKMEDRP